MSAKAAPVKTVVPAVPAKALTPVRTPVLLRACSCGSPPAAGGTCDSCAAGDKKKRSCLECCSAPPPACRPPVCRLP